MTSRVDFVVAKGKTELRRASVRVVDDGTLVDADPSADGEPDITFTVTEPLAEALNNGDLDLSVGFMRGQVKMTGDFGALLRFLPLSVGASLRV